MTDAFHSASGDSRHDGRTFSFVPFVATLFRSNAVGGEGNIDLGTLGINGPKVFPSSIGGPLGLELAPTNERFVA